MAVDVADLVRRRMYPGLIQVEADIAREWIRAHGAEYDDVLFNVRLGEGVDPGPAFDQSTRTSMIAVTQKRADIVAQRAAGVTLIEIKARLDFRAAGQLIGYRGLWARQFPSIPVERLLAIGRSIASDVEAIILGQGIELELFPVAE